MNIQLKTPLKEEDIKGFMDWLNPQMREQNGKGFNYELRGNTVHMEWEHTDIAVVEEGQKKISRLYGSKVQAGTRGAMAVSRGDIKRAMKAYFKEKGIKLEFKGMFG